ncbi:hypothetical protein E8E11_007086 [Didymella keratinophila]|nr:hypothetical protein E8E11_007086 [Didymella keratinophila]
MAQTRPRSKKPDKLALTLAGDTVIDQLGQERKRCCVHRAVLCHYPKYLQHALNGSWKEEEEGVVSLADVEIETFDLFADWIYSQHLFTGNDITLELWRLLNTSEKGEALLKAFRRYMRALVFGDHFLAHTFKRAVHLRFTKMLTEWGFWVNGSVEAVRYIYENIPL